MNCHQDPQPNRGAQAVIAALVAAVVGYFLVLPVASFFIDLASEVQAVGGVK